MYTYNQYYLSFFFQYLIVISASLCLLDILAESRMLGPFLSRSTSSAIKKGVKKKQICLKTVITQSKGNLSRGRVSVNYTPNRIFFTLFQFLVLKYL